MNIRKYWSSEEFKLLKELYEIKGLPPSELVKILKRDRISVLNKITRSNLHHTDEQIKIIRSKRVKGKNNPMYGKIGWRKGLTKENSEKSRMMGKKTSQTRKIMFKKGLLPDISGKNNPMYGKTAWNKGLTKETSNIIQKISKKLSKFHKDKWLNLSEEEKQVKRKYCALIGANCKKRRTSIELIIENVLKNQNIDYISGYYKDNMVFDFYLPKYNFVIECQGDYWHSNPIKYNITNINEIQKRNIQRDNKKKDYLLKNNIKILFLWEYDIKKNIKTVTQQILESVNSYI